MLGRTNADERTLGGPSVHPCVQGQAFVRSFVRLVGYVRSGSPVLAHKEFWVGSNSQSVSPSVSRLVGRFFLRWFVRSFVRRTVDRQRRHPIAHSSVRKLATCSNGRPVARPTDRPSGCQSSYERVSKPSSPWSLQPLIMATGTHDSKPKPKTGREASHYEGAEVALRARLLPLSDAGRCWSTASTNSMDSRQKCRCVTKTTRSDSTHLSLLADTTSLAIDYLVRRPARNLAEAGSMMLCMTRTEPILFDNPRMRRPCTLSVHFESLRLWPASIGKKKS